ncbi:MAG: SpoIIE family protein phosphatase [Lachnospiraceae bacterium]|nr:SpoIIE family protein phosphatase [Lachnospiraceae bacterium]
MKKLFGEPETEQIFLLSDYGRQKLLAYADSFKELARTLGQNLAWEDKAGSREDALYRKELLENRCLLAENLNEMAGVMAQMAAEVFSYRPFPAKKARQIVQTMQSEGILVNDLYYIEQEPGRTKINLTMRAERMPGVGADEAADMLSVLLDQRLAPSMNCPRVIDSRVRGFTFVEEARYVMLTGAAKAIKENESKSGDNYSILESEKGKMTLLLSDGMGSGEKACADSEAVLDLMEKLLEAGYGPHTAAELVNNTMLAGGEQNMSTLDICEADLYDGTCTFMKVGAAASFIKREHMVEQISSASLPLGAIRGIEECSVRRRLMDGDYVFLLSDGIVDALENCDYKEELCEILGNLEQESPRELAEALLQIVLRKTGGHIRDDMTIVVFGLWENV